MSDQIQSQTQPIKLEFVPLDNDTVSSILLVDVFKPEKARRAKVRSHHWASPSATTKRRLTRGTNTCAASTVWNSPSRCRPRSRTRF
jgi:hypothetical protein